VVSQESFNKFCLVDPLKDTNAYLDVCKLFSTTIGNETLTNYTEGKLFVDAGYLTNQPPSFEDNPMKAAHYGFLFNVYVLMQLFNLVNARKLLAHEWNPFANFFNNRYFLGILIVAIIVQVGLVNINLLGSVLKIKRPSFALQGISIAIGSTSILWGKYFNLI
jgi:magnesium-transporting ATPase (P-type)